MTGNFVTVLGPVTIDGEDLTKRQQAIVAALVLYGTGGASTDVLIDAVWPVEAPPAARPALQNQIARLRERFGAQIITTGPQGYRLTGRSDVAEFVQFASLGLARPPASAIGHLEHALELWQGDPYAVLSDHVRSGSERARLVATHDDAAEHLMFCRIAVGELRRAIEQLSAMVRDDPYRERRWELLMRAQYLHGRRTDALATFKMMRMTLRDELGAQPSGSLVELNKCIERGDDLPQSDVVDLTDQRKHPTGDSTPAYRNRAKCQLEYRSR